MNDFKFDEIGEWSCAKLDILESYLKEYTKILAKYPYLKYAYIDGFSGAGVHLTKETKELILGSPLRALNAKPPFHAYHFIDMNEKKLAFLSNLSQGHSNVEIHPNDCSRTILENIFPRYSHKSYWRLFCFLDPYGLHLQWEVLARAAKKQNVEVVLHFPMMDMNRNPFRRDPDPKQLERITKFWGDDSWRKAAYSNDGMLFEDMEEKQSNEKIVAAFKERLKNVAGFEYVSDPTPMKCKGKTIYYLLFAGQNKTGYKIMSHILKNHRSKAR